MGSHSDRTETVRLFHRARAMPFMAVALGSWPGIARAGSLVILVTESGGPAIPIADNSSLDTDPTVGVINVDTAPSGGINTLLVNYQFARLGADSNSPGSSQGGA